MSNVELTVRPRFAFFGFLALAAAAWPVLRALGMSDPIGRAVLLSGAVGVLVLGVAMWASVTYSIADGKVLIRRFFRTESIDLDRLRSLSVEEGSRYSSFDSLRLIQEDGRSVTTGIGILSAQDQRRFLHAIVDAAPGASLRMTDSLRRMLGTAEE